MDNIQEVTWLSQAAATYYVRALPWARRHAADLVQEATLAVLKCKQSFDPTRGVPFSRYAYKAALLAVRRYLWRNRGSLGTQHPNGGRGEALLAITEVSYDAVRSAFEEQPSLSTLPPTALAEARFRAGVRKTLKALDQSGGIALRVVLDEQEPAAVAKATRKPVRAVYKARKNLVRRARRSPELRALYEEHIHG